MIIIERDALLSVLSRPPLHNDCHDEEEYVLVLESKKLVERSLVQPLRQSTSFDDCCSLASTTSSDSSVRRSPRVVTFSEEDKVHIVDRLYPKDLIGRYFYSCEDTKRSVSSFRGNTSPFLPKTGPCDFFSHVYFSV